MVTPIRALQEAQRRSARASSISASRCTPATSWRRSPTSSTTWPAPEGIVCRPRTQGGGAHRGADGVAGAADGHSEILRVISSSPTDIQPVFETILANATRLCDAARRRWLSTTGKFLTNVANQNATPEFPWTSLRARVSVRGPGRPRARAACSSAGRSTSPTAPMIRSTRQPAPFQREEAVRTVLSVPLLRENALVGVVTMWRREVRPFSDKQIALVQTFADQAVIAIENVRLFKELQARNAEVTESLEQQTAIAEILRVISSSPTDVMPVLEAVTHRAAQLCDAPDARPFMVEGDTLKHVTGFGELSGVLDSLPLTRGSWSVARSSTGRPCISMIWPPRWTNFRRRARRNRLFGHRTTLAVPLVRENRACRRHPLRRREVRPFTREADRAGQDLRRPGHDRDRERAPVQRDPGQEPPARGRQQAQVRVPRQHVARAAHAVERGHRLLRGAAASACSAS